MIYLLIFRVLEWIENIEVKEGTDSKNRLAKLFHPSLIEDLLNLALVMAYSYTSI